jgi:GMP synthase (glutamine-hydrolysing)
VRASYGLACVSSSLLVLQHIACEPPAAFEHELRARGLDLVRVELDEGEALPDLREFSATIVMGGPMGAYEEERHPWLGEEKRTLGAAARAGHPVWGVCLGAQLLAGALGARVYPGPEPEVGVLAVELTKAAAEDPVFGGAPSSFPALQWHGDTFELPDGALLLASSAAYPNQAFCFERAYGIQFHLEVSPELAARWGEVPAYEAALERIEGVGALDRLVGQVNAHADATLPLARDLFGRWLTQVARVPALAIG